MHREISKRLAFVAFAALLATVGAVNAQAAPRIVACGRTGFPKWDVFLSNGDVYERTQQCCLNDTTWAFCGNILSAAGVSAGQQLVGVLFPLTGGANAMTSGGDKLSGGAGCGGWNVEVNIFKSANRPVEEVVAYGEGDRLCAVTASGAFFQDGPNGTAAWSYLGTVDFGSLPTSSATDSWGRLKIRYR